MDIWLCQHVLLAATCLILDFNGGYITLSNGVGYSIHDWIAMTANSVTTVRAQTRDKYTTGTFVAFLQTPSKSAWCIRHSYREMRTLTLRRRLVIRTLCLTVQRAPPLRPAFFIYAHLSSITGTLRHSHIVSCFSCVLRRARPASSDTARHRCRLRVFLSCRRVRLAAPSCPPPFLRLRPARRAQAGRGS